MVEKSPAMLDSGRAQGQVWLGGEGNGMAPYHPSPEHGPIPPFSRACALCQAREWQEHARPAHLQA